MKQASLKLSSQWSVPMPRQGFTERLKQSMKPREMRTVSTTCLILTELKGCDVAARGMAAEDLCDIELGRMV